MFAAVTWCHWLNFDLWTLLCPSENHLLALCGFSGSGWIIWSSALQKGYRITQKKMTKFLLTDSLVYSIFFHALSPSVKTFIGTVRAPGLDGGEATVAFKDWKGVVLLSWESDNWMGKLERLASNLQLPTIKTCVTNLKQTKTSLEDEWSDCNNEVYLNDCM